MGQERMTYQMKSFQKAQNFLQHREQPPVSAHRKDLWAGNHASLLSHSVLLHSYCMPHQHLISTPKSLSYYSLFFFPPLLHITIKSRQSVILKAAGQPPSLIMGKKNVCPSWLKYSHKPYVTVLASWC